ncbi:B12-binding domain-containing radical SAM protein [Candidatus Woesearchaeota archaeon]|nr:B12-binding domain-containing radical SAM protein [Candidatus Woesearchaeota archaeon]
MRLEKIVLVELDSDLPSLGKLLAMPRYGITAIGSILDEAGYDVKVLCDVYGKVSIEEILSENPDYILFNGIKTSIDRVRAMANEVRAKTDSPIIIGGEEATTSPENVQDFADYVVLHEGDKTILDLIKALKSGGEFSKIKGIMYKKSGGWVYTGKPERIEEINHHLNPEIFRGLKDIKKGFLAKWLNISGLRLISFPIQTSRGCPYECSFCSKDAQFGKKGYFERDIGDVIEDIDRVMEYSGITEFAIVDNLFGYSKEYAKEFFERVIAYFEKPKPRFSALMRADQFKGFSDENISLMKKAGFKSVNLGMESINQKTLDQYDKGEVVGDYDAAVKRLDAHDIAVLGSFAVGGGEDRLADVYGIVNFARRLKMRQIHLYPFSITPGTKEYKEHKHLVIPSIPDKYWNGHAVTIFPKKMLPSELQETTFNTMWNFYRSYHLSLPLKTLIHKFLFYTIAIRRIEKSLTSHLDFLKTKEAELIEKGIYQRSSEGWELDEGKLINSS